MNNSEDIMIIGIPMEIKNRERRVSLTPERAASLTHGGHIVLVEQGAGIGSGFSDAEYLACGAQIVDTAAAWNAPLVIKVKEPLPSEYALMRPGGCLFTYLHLAAVPELLPVLIGKNMRAIGYETVQAADGSLPLLAPMSHVAGRVAVQIGAGLLQSENGTPFPGKGKLMGGIAGVAAARVLILGGGNAGINAAQVASGMGAEVCILDANAARVASLNAQFAQHSEPGNKAKAELFDAQRLPGKLADCDLLIGATLMAGEHAAHLLNAEALASMNGGVFIDIAIDQGGISETSRPTSYADPVYLEAGVLHCCLPNLPACVPLSATLALTHATFPYIRQLADEGIEAAVRGASEQSMALARGVNTWDGHITHPGVARALEQNCTALGDLFKD